MISPTGRRARLRVHLALLRRLVSDVRCVGLDRVEQDARLHTRVLARLAKIENIVEGRGK